MAILSLFLVACSSPRAVSVTGPQEPAEKAPAALQPEEQEPEGREAGEADVEEEVARVKVELYVMSKCPYCQEAVKGMLEVLGKMGNFVDFSQNYIASESEDGTFKSMHGHGEVIGDIIQLCAAKYFPQDYKYLALSVCMSGSLEDIPNNWRECAAGIGIDASVIEPCVSGDEGKALLSQSINASKAAKATGAPTIIIAGEKYVSKRTADKFQQTICCAFKPEEIPAPCSEGGALSCPKHVAFNLIVLSDERCEDCGDKSKNWIKKFLIKFPEAVIKELDYSDPEGRNLYEETGAKLLPVGIFDQSVKEDAEYDSISSWMLPAGDYLILELGAHFDPTREICDNGMDDTGNGKVDCKDADCKKTLACRGEKSSTFELFIRSHCPYSMEVMKPVLAVVDHFKGKLKFRPRYLAQVYTQEEYDHKSDQIKSNCVKMEDGNYYTALHGEKEIEEQRRQLCTVKLFSKGYKYLDYIVCRAEDFNNPDWKGCALNAGLDVKKIEKCAAGKEGLKLLKADADLAEELGIKASPTFLINNTTIVKPKKRTFEGIKEAVCVHNDKLKGCE